MSRDIPACRSQYSTRWSLQWPPSCSAQGRPCSRSEHCTACTPRHFGPSPEHPRISSYRRPRGTGSNHCSPHRHTGRYCTHPFPTRSSAQCSCSPASRRTAVGTFCTCPPGSARRWARGSVRLASAPHRQCRCCSGRCHLHWVLRTGFGRELPNSGRPRPGPG